MCATKKYSNVTENWYKIKINEETIFFYPLSEAAVVLMAALDGQPSLVRFISDALFHVERFMLPVEAPCVYNFTVPLKIVLRWCTVIMAQVKWHSNNGTGINSTQQKYRGKKAACG